MTIRRALTPAGLCGRLLRLLTLSEQPPSAQTPHEFSHVDPDNPRCVQVILELTKGLAWRRFGRQPNAEEMVQDAMSVAWEFAQLGKGTPWTVVTFAIRRVASGGQFSRSVQSVDHRQPHPTRRRRDFFDEAKLGSNGANPAEVAAFRIDFQDWWATLTRRQQEVVSTLAVGNNTVEAAQILGCTRGGVSVMRGTLAKKYEAFFTLAGSAPGQMGEGDDSESSERAIR